MEFTATECIRPSILKRSLASFNKNLRGVNFGVSTLWINIDPVPQNKRWEDVYNIAKRYFKVINCNTPDRPNFCQAVKWCWSRPTSSIFFHLELDWELREEVDVLRMKRLLHTKGTAAVNLRAYPKKKHVMCLSPCLLRTKIAQSIALRMNPKLNPERQLRKKGPKEPYGKNLQGKHMAIHYPAQKVIFDIGRAWMIENKINKTAKKKPKKAKLTKHNFNRWY